MNKKEKLVLQLVEYSPEWEDTEINLSFLSKLFEGNSSVDIIFLPEMFNTGFSMNSHKISEKMDGKTINWMKDISVQHHTAICGSLAIEENNQYYNRFIFVAEGEIKAQYDKHHLFSYGGESEVYTPGNKKVVFEYLGWKICPIICFDLRFPVWSRNIENYDLLIVPACWPNTRIEVWDTLLKARAIENVSYVCGINRTGTDGMNLSYPGHSIAFSPIGKPIKQEIKKETIFHYTLSLEEIKKWRTKYKFLDERDLFEIL